MRAMVLALSEVGVTEMEMNSYMCVCIGAGLIRVWVTRNGDELLSVCALVLALSMGGVT